VTVTSDTELLTALATFEKATSTLADSETCVRTIIFDGTRTAYQLNRSITLDGSGAFAGLVLNATGLSDMVTITAAGGRHFQLTGVNLTAENVRFSGGVASEAGGGSIYATLGSNLTFRQVAFADNSVEYGGKVRQDVPRGLRVVRQLYLYSCLYDACRWWRCTGL
jgi:hypothetical protein